MKVLVVEDDADVRELVRRALEAERDFSVEECSAAEDALAAARSLRPDLVLLDVMMPDLDGLSVARALRAEKETAGTAIVFLTACLRPEDIARYADLGALDVIAKPFDPGKLAARLRRALGANVGAQAAASAALVLDSLERGYRSELPDRVQDIERRLAELPQMGAAVAKEAALLAHRMAGSAAVFGMSALSAAARALEDALGRFLIEDALESSRKIEGLVGELRRRADDQTAPV